MMGSNLTKYILDGRCLFHFLFKINPKMMALAEKKMHEVWGHYPVDYLAWHWRVGGMVGEERGQTHYGNPLDLSRLAQMIVSTKCLETMANNTLVDQRTPALLVTDLNIIRKFVAAGYVTGLTATADVAVHSDIVRNLNESAYLPIYMDILMLARAKCLLLQQSGISMIAAWLSNNTCHMLSATCIERNSWLLGNDVHMRLRQLKMKLRGAF